MEDLQNLQMHLKQTSIIYLTTFQHVKVHLLNQRAVAVQAVKEGELLFGDTVAVFGADPIGLLTVIAAKTAGASKIFVFDLSEERLEKAKSVGATHTFNSDKVDPVQAVYDNTENGIDLSFEVAGVGTTFQQTIDLIANGSLNVKDVVTDEIELDNIVESGFNQLVNDKSQAKILVRLNGNQK